MPKLGLVAAAVVATAALVLADRSLAGGPAKIKVGAQPLHDGRVKPALFGNFIELLDDLVPGMRAEMLNDRGFEGVAPRAGWVFATGEPNLCDRTWEETRAWTPDTASPWNGKRSARLEPSGETPGSVSQGGLAVTKGKAYRFSGWLRAERDGSSALVSLRVRFPDEEWHVVASARVGGVGREWKRFEAELPSTGTTDSAVFELSTGTEGRIWADQLSLEPKDNQDGWRPDVVDAVRELHPGVIRWGGSVCDPGGYRWKTGIGERDARAPFANAVWGRIDSNDVGVDEFCRFCELVQAEPLICLSFADGPGSAADLVEYLNGAPSTVFGARRAANGHPEPYRVKLWQLGNELGDAAYVKGLPALCAAMKKADPDAVLFTSFPSPELLASVSKDVAFVCPHHYTPDLNACAADLDRIAADIRRTPGCERVKIGITEWNVTGGDFGLGRERLKTLGTALDNARYLNLLVRRCDVVELACRSNLANSLGSGVLETRPRGLLLRPTYHVLKLYAGHARPIPLAVPEKPEGLDVAACRSDDGKALTVFAVNLGRDPVDVALDLPPGFAAVRVETVADTLDGRQRDVMNHWEAPGRVRPVERAAGATITLPAFSVSAIECAAP